MSFNSLLLDRTNFSWKFVVLVAFGRSPSLKGFTLNKIQAIKSVHLLGI